MKILHKLIKRPSSPAKAKANSKTVVDVIATNYGIVKVQEKALKKETEELKTRVENLIKSSPENLLVIPGKGEYLVGNNYRVGFTEAKPTPVVSIAKLKKKYPMLAKKLIAERVVVEIDNEAFVRAVEEGKIPASQVESLMEPIDPDKIQRRIYVGRVTEELE